MFILELNYFNHFSHFLRAIVILKTGNRTQPWDKLQEICFDWILILDWNTSLFAVMRIVADKSFIVFFFFCRRPSLQIQSRASQKQRRSRKAQMYAVQTRIQLSQQLAFTHAYSHTRETVPVQVLQEVVLSVFNASESHQAPHRREALQV